jgi:hypothetical protein
MTGRFQRKMAASEPLRVLYLNDLGFQFGAGVATMRQIQSLVRRGDTVMGLCYADSELSSFQSPLAPDNAGEWLGFHCLHALHGQKCGLAADELGDAICGVAAGSYPDLIIVGNIHSAYWPVSLIPRLRCLGAEVVTYMHDCFYMTGRCAYAGPCRKYLVGCDAQCPTAHDYPALEPKLIAGAWAERRKVFGPPHRVPLVTNSRWTQRFVSQAIPEAKVDLIHYGIDAELFVPKNKAEARRLLELPADGLIVLGGAINLLDVRKGGACLQQLFGRLAPEVHRVVFGTNSTSIPGVHAIDMQFSQRRIKLLYQAADVFVNTSLEEAFGQMMLEAAACGVPIAAFDAGGVADIARHGVNALLAPPGDVAQLQKAVEFFLNDAAARRDFGLAGRNIVLHEFSLDRQAENWTRYLRGLAGCSSVAQKRAAPQLAAL